MEKLSNVEKLSRYLIYLGILAIVCALCRYFSSVLVYIILAFVVSLISRPLARLMGKIRIKRSRLAAVNSIHHLRHRSPAAGSHYGDSGGDQYHQRRFSIQQ